MGEFLSPMPPFQEQGRDLARAGSSPLGYGNHFHVKLTKNAAASKPQAAVVCWGWQQCRREERDKVARGGLLAFVSLCVMK